MLQVATPINFVTTFQTPFLTPASLRIPTQKSPVKAQSKTPSVWSSERFIQRLKSISNKSQDKPSRKLAMTPMISVWITRQLSSSSLWTSKAQILLNQSICKRTNLTLELEIKAWWLVMPLTRLNNLCLWVIISAVYWSEDYNIAEEKKSYHGWGLMQRFKWPLNMKSQDNWLLLWESTLSWFHVNTTIMSQMKQSEAIYKSSSSEKLFQKNGFKTPSLFLIQVEDSLSEDQLVMQDWLVEKLSLTLTEDGEDTEEEPSQEKTHQRLIDLLLMLPDGSLRTLLPTDSARELWFKSHTVSDFQSHWAFSLTVTTLLKMDTLIKIWLVSWPETSI